MGDHKDSMHCVCKTPVLTALCGSVLARCLLLLSFHRSDGEGGRCVTKRTGEKISRWAIVAEGGGGGGTVRNVQM